MIYVFFATVILFGALVAPFITRWILRRFGL